MLVGGLLGLALGGAPDRASPRGRRSRSPPSSCPLLALPTLLRTREPERASSRPRRARDRRPAGYYLQAAAARASAASSLAQILWVLGYAALPAFFLLYAEEELGLAPSVASLLLAGFGVATGAADRRRRAASATPRCTGRCCSPASCCWAPASSASSATTEPGAASASALLAAAVGFGLVSTLGFPLFSELHPGGRGGRLHGALLLGALDLVDDRAARRRAGRSPPPEATARCSSSAASRRSPRCSRSCGCRARSAAHAARRRPAGASCRCSACSSRRPRLHRLDERALLARSTASAPGRTCSGRSSIRTRATTSS